MERGGLTRWLLIGLAVFLAITFLPKIFGKKSAKPQPLQYESQLVPAHGPAPKQCNIFGKRFHAVLTTQGADIEHFYLTTAKYQKDGKPIDLSTTPGQPFRRQLRFDWRNLAVAGAKDASWQTNYDMVDWKLDHADGKSCTFSYRDAKVELTRTISTTGRPYELAVKATIKNLSNEKLTHALTVHSVVWRTAKEVKSHLFRVSPFVTWVECVNQSGKTTRLREKDFEPDKFKKDSEFARNALNQGDWYQAKGEPDVAAVSNAYFSNALIPVDQHRPVCQLQIEERWNADRYSSPSDDPNGGAMYRARLAYKPVELAPGQSAEYRLVSYVGPKERDVLAAAAGGKHQLSQLIDLGFFSAIAKIMVDFLLKVHSIVPNWGVAIIVLTITARTLLFPLTWPSIKSMIKMRELKPELDALNEKYKDDAQAKGLAQMELWRKHNVNPIKGCLPQLASMPVWFALYTTLETAVELYNIPFLWFPDLSAPDPYYILPFVIGIASFAQQAIMPMQGDATQQKMMRYAMPVMFTVFMLFLPSGLGVYMFTNSLLGIAQQQIVERHVRRQTAAAKARGDDIEVKTKEETSGKPGSKAKAKGKAADRASEAKSSDAALLGKGKA
jgi:YidC/Oxa1 family membrane protein insertase